MLRDLGGRGGGPGETLVIRTGTRRFSQVTPLALEGSGGAGEARQG